MKKDVLSYLVPLKILQQKNIVFILDKFIHFMPSLEIQGFSNRLTKEIVLGFDYLIGNRPFDKCFPILFQRNKWERKGKDRETIRCMIY